MSQQNFHIYLKVNQGLNGAQDGVTIYPVGEDLRSWYLNLIGQDKKTKKNYDKTYLEWQYGDRKVTGYVTINSRDVIYTVEKAAIAEVFNRLVSDKIIAIDDVEIDGKKEKQIRITELGMKTIPFDKI